ncbi:MAG: IS200/IS605 family transposase [Bacteroidaceae bacterium]|nr:IS200/IS605 family transposase [Bacteroidaceae bacterium]
MGSIWVYPKSVCSIYSLNHAANIHIIFLISYPPNISVTSIVRKLKQESTIFAWRHFENKLKREFWAERTLWSDGYFVCSIGEANPETIRRYIEQQG